MRLLNFSDGYTSSTEPPASIIVSGGFVVYASDAAFITAKGSPASEGDAYANSTDHTVHYYNGTSWEILGGFTVPIAQALITSGIVVLPRANQIKQYISGNSGAINVTGTPQIVAGYRDGQELLVQCTSDTFTVQFSDGRGLRLNGDFIMKKDYKLFLTWDATQSVWSEVSRREF